MWSWFWTIWKLLKWVVLVWLLITIFILLSNYFIPEFLCNLKIFSMDIMEKWKIFMDVFFPNFISTIRIFVVFMFLKIVVWKFFIWTIKKSTENSSNDGST